MHEGCLLLLYVVLYGKVDRNTSIVNLEEKSRKDISKLLNLAPMIRGCFFPEDYGYMVINVEEGERVHSYQN